MPTAKDRFHDWGPHTLASAASQTPDFTEYFRQHMTLTADTTINNPTGLRAGATYVLYCAQDGTGGHTLEFGSVYKFLYGESKPLTLSRPANALDVFKFYCPNGTDLYLEEHTAFGVLCALTDESGDPLFDASGNILTETC